MEARGGFPFAPLIWYNVPMNNTHSGERRAFTVMLIASLVGAAWGGMESERRSSGPEAERAGERRVRERMQARMEAAPRFPEAVETRQQRRAKARAEAKAQRRIA